MWHDTRSQLDLNFHRLPPHRPDRPGLVQMSAGIVRLGDERVVVGQWQLNWSPTTNASVSRRPGRPAPGRRLCKPGVSGQFVGGHLGQGYDLHLICREPYPHRYGLEDYSVSTVDIEKLHR